MTEVELAFLASQYIVSGRGEDIQYQKLIDDVQNAQRNQPDDTKTGDPKSICNAIVKSLFILGMDMGAYFRQNASSMGTFTNSELREVLGTRM